MKNKPQPESPIWGGACLLFRVAAADEITRPAFVMPVWEDSDDEYAGAERDIAMTFRRQLAGLRRLPPRERPSALYQARKERTLALRALREKRAVTRDARYRLRQRMRPARKMPSPTV